MKSYIKTTKNTCHVIHVLDDAIDPTFVYRGSLKGYKLISTLGAMKIMAYRSSHTHDKCTESFIDGKEIITSEVSNFRDDVTDCKGGVIFHLTDEVAKRFRTGNEFCEFLTHVCYLTKDVDNHRISHISYARSLEDFDELLEVYPLSTVVDVMLHPHIDNLYILLDKDRGTVQPVIYDAPLYQEGMFAEAIKEGLKRIEDNCIYGALNPIGRRESK